MPGSARRALADAVDHNAVLVSYSPEQELGSFWERVLIPFVYCRLSAKFSFARVNNPQTAGRGSQWPISDDPARRVSESRRPRRYRQRSSGRCRARPPRETSRLQNLFHRAPRNHPHSYVPRLLSALGRLDQKSLSADGWHDQASAHRTRRGFSRGGDLRAAYRCRALLRGAYQPSLSLLVALLLLAISPALRLRFAEQLYRESLPAFIHQILCPRSVSLLRRARRFVVEKHARVQCTGRAGLSLALSLWRRNPAAKDAMIRMTRKLEFSARRTSTTIRISRRKRTGASSASAIIRMGTGTTTCWK